MFTQPLDAIPLWSLPLLLIALLWGCMEGGYRIGRWRHRRHPDEREQPVGAMVASILGLLALVLAFTFSLAASRFDARRQAVLEEANAIGTTYLRAQLLPDEQRSQVTALLREYVGLRIGGRENDTAQALARSQVVHDLLWEQARSAAEADPHSIMTGLFVQSLNEVIDLHAKRVLAGLHSRIPIVLWICLLGLASLGMGAVGYQAGLATSGRSPAMPGLAMAFGVVLLLIADLDRGQEGLLRISQQALIDVQRTMQQSSPSRSP